MYPDSESSVALVERKEITHQTGEGILTSVCVFPFAKIIIK